MLVDPDKDAVERARGEGFTVVHGDAASEEVLRSAGIEDADAVGALTGDLNANYAACAIANEYGCRTVMRIDEEYREEIYRKHVNEVDQIVYPERLGAVVAKNALTGGNIRAIADIEQSLQIVEFTVTADSPMEDYTLSELELPGTARLIAYGSKGDSLRLPTADDALENGDRVVILGDAKNLGEIRQLLVGEPAQPQPGGV
jgi:trk system potassium uptake protein TrkA